MKRVASPWPLLVIMLFFLGCDGETVPAAPGTLQASNVTSTALVLSWSDMSDNEEGFNLEKSQNEDFSEVDSFTLAPDTVTYQDANLLPSTDYYYRVSAFNEAGESEYSNVVHCHTLDEEEPDDNTEEKNKKVFAHYMLAYAVHGIEIEDYQQEIRDAQAAGIDGFALNAAAWSSEQRYQIAASSMFDAAESMDTDFKLFFSADLCCGLTKEDIQDMITTYSGRSNYLKHDNRPVLSTFAGSSDPDWWNNNVLDPLKAQGADVFFVPFLYPFDPAPSNPELPDYDTLLENYNKNWRYFVDGMFYFGAAGLPWGNPSLVNSGEAYAQLMHENEKLFMAGFSCLYWGMVQQVNGRRYYEYQGGEGIQEQWLSIINNQDPEWVEIVTWNDIAESYIVPADNIRDHGAYEREAGFYHNHAAYLELTKYYIEWFKNGAPPSITRDALFYFYRTHPMDATAGDDSYGQVTGRHGDVRDVIYITTMLTSPAKLTVTSGEVSQTYDVQTGVQHTQVPFNTGNQSFSLTRDGAQLLSLQGKEITDSINQYNFFNTAGYAYAD